MNHTLIDGQAVARSIRERLAGEVTAARSRRRAPQLAAVLIGDDGAAEAYARSQARQAAACGIEYRLVRLAAGTGLRNAEEAITSLNADTMVDGVMLHLPVPAGLDGFALQQAISLEKDVEGVGAANLGLLAMGRPALPPCTAAAAMACIRAVCPDLTGKEAVVVGRSTIVGKPAAMLLLAAQATVTQCHTRTRDLAAHTRRAEVLVVAAGKARLIGAEHVGRGAIVIDVGIHRVPGDGGATRTVGDVRTEEVAPIASAITPVPGGVGPVTVAMLLENTVTAWRRGEG